MRTLELTPERLKAKMKKIKIKMKKMYKTLPKIDQSKKSNKMIKMRLAQHAEKVKIDLKKEISNKTDKSNLSKFL